MARCLIGTSGYSYDHWSGSFYPEDLPVEEKLEFYARHFPVVEINSTFYRLPGSPTFIGWEKKAREGFIMAIKANRYITHLKKLKDPEESLENLLSRARLLKGHLGPLLYQLPPHWRPNLERLKHFLSVLPQDLCHVMEFRDGDWFEPPVKELLEEYGVGFCIHDFPGLGCPHWVTSSLVYLRMHGVAGAYQGKYDRAYLRLLAKEIKGYLEEGKEVYAFFNNDQEGYAAQNALELQKILS